jgi:hypothetical protein
MHMYTPIQNINLYIIYQGGEVHDYSQSAKIRARGAKAIRDFSTVVYILFFSLLDTLKPFLIIIINQIILPDATAPSCHFLTVGMKIVYVNQ